MASFDLNTFLKVQGSTGTGAVQALGMSFGVPSCIINLTNNLLQLLPSSILTDIRKQAFEGKAKANEITKEVFKKLMLDTGIIEFDTESGTFKFGSDTSWMGIDDDDKQSNNDLAGLLGAFQYATAFGAQLYQNYTNITNEINAVKECLDKLNTVKKFKAGSSGSFRTAQQIQASYTADKARLDKSAEFITKADALIASIDSILQARSESPELEPQIYDCQEFDPFLSGTSFCRVPLEDAEVLAEANEVFRLTYGPPVSVDGQYILTNDGLYYDSQSGGLDPAYAAISGIVVPVGEEWTYNYNPNLGGKGQVVSLDSLNKFKGNLFDPSLIDDSAGMQVYYDKDHFLAVLKQQRDKHIFDLSAQLTQFINNGEGQSVIQNQKQLIVSEMANHNSKISRRKKQIEVAVKGPQVYGGNTSPIFAPGDVPINDFSYLADNNLTVDLEKQKALTFKQGDVDGIILPIQPKYVQASLRSPSIKLEHLKLPVVGKGSILYSPSGTNEVKVLSLTDQIVTDDLFAIYNFLSTDIQLPSSTNFNVTNCATANMYNNAQLVAPSKRSVFFSGVAIPYLEGIVKNKSSDTKAASGLGSFVKLPDTKEFRDLTYSQTGFTIECWVHVPNITNIESGWLNSTTSSLTKVLIGCENVGVANGYSAIDHLGNSRDLDYLANDRGGQVVRGMLCGFTRDRRITQSNAGFSNLSSLNHPVSSLSFFIAPTQSKDFSSASFINNSDCQSTTSFHKMKVDLSATAFGNVSSQFVLIDITCDPVNDTIKMYADGALVATSSISSVFGVESNKAPSLPSFKKDNSFEYSQNSVDGPTILKQGPLLNTFYTPWIVGGGYTDGMYQYGNFMGGNRGGLVSGLRGHIGSLKFYSRPLDNSEVLVNYKAQQGFFKTIQI